jgi:hypothetical protein
MTKNNFRVIIFFFVFFVVSCQGQSSLLFAKLTPTPTFTNTPTVTFTPSPTSTPIVVSRVIPTDYYRISKTKFTIFNNDEATSICIQIYTHRAIKSINDETIEVMAISEYQPMVGDCFDSQPKQWSYQINIYTGEITTNLQEDVDTSTIYFGKNFTSIEEDMFSLSGIAIPVWKFTKPIEKKDMLDRFVVFEGSEENTIDKATGILIYQSRFVRSIPDPAITYFLETISLSTNAPIGGSREGTEFAYSKEK